MVWTYTEYYPKHPYLVDWVGKKWKSIIEATEDIKSIEPSSKDNTSIIRGNGILRPVFYLAPGQERQYQLKTGRREELKRVSLSPMNKGAIGDYDAIHQISRPMNLADFEDFKQFAIYGAQRIPQIATEITRDPAEFKEDIPESELDLILRNRENCLQVVSWDITQKQICNEFSGNITLWASYSLSGNHRGQIKPRVRHFNESQLDELDAILVPLTRT
ncbi:hypothetical protein J4423_00860 [Candidatus Pacearchaeota archaeon]|nr:hypothetical protein [Candidatus Pacearchaeota archaeon]